MSSCSCCHLPSTRGRVRWCSPGPQCFLPAFPRLVPDTLEAREKTSVWNIPGGTLYPGVFDASRTPSLSPRLRSEWGSLTLLFGSWRQLGKDVWMLWWHCPRSLSPVPFREEALWPPLTAKLQATGRTLFFSPA